MLDISTVRASMIVLLVLMRRESATARFCSASFAVLDSDMTYSMASTSSSPDA